MSQGYRDPVKVLKVRLLLGNPRLIRERQYMVRSSSFLKRAVSLLIMASGAQLIGCGPKVQITPPLGATIPTHIALLPADYSVDIPKERIDLVHNSIISELRNRNFVVADEKVVTGICSSPTCPERERLASQYLVDGFVTLRVDSFSKNSFLAGYYNQLSGILTIEDGRGEKLLAVSHTESERGGLIFNTGQLVQGILSQLRNSGDIVFKDLASEFAETVTDQIPAPASTRMRAQEGLEVNIAAVTALWQSPTTYIVCVNGSPNSFASLLIGDQRASLREINPGTYCGAFSALVNANGSVTSAVELRTAFGNAVRKDVQLPAQAPCKLDDRVRVSDSQISILCSSIGKDNSRAQLGCSETSTLCKAEKIVLFQALSEGGPYKKILETGSSSAKMPSTSAQVAVLAVGSGGIPSLPVTVLKQAGSEQ